jgi:hypothetical protein
MMAMAMMVPVLRADVGRRVLLRAGVAGRVGGSTGERRSTDSHRDKEILHVITPVERGVTTDGHAARSDECGRRNDADKFRSTRANERTSRDLLSHEAAFVLQLP